MAENKQCGLGGGRETVSIDTNRILDSCRDKDCFENVRVYLTGYGQDIIDRVSAVRAKYAKILWAYIDIDPVPFNRGFYQLNIKIYVKIICEVCVAPGNIQEIEGIAVVEKKVILFGSEGNVSVFKSESGQCGFCKTHDKCACKRTNNLPTAVIETVDPIILSSNIVEPRQSGCCCCCCSADEIPESVCCHISGDIDDRDDCNKLVVTLGLFSVVRIERPAQYLINAVEYCVPDKECSPCDDEDPCHMFRKMAFPTGEFCPPGMTYMGDNGQKRCACGG